MPIAVVTPMMRSGERGGAEALYDGLVGSLRGAGYEVDRVEVVIDESSFDAILESYRSCSELDLERYDLVISTKAPTYMVRHRNHVSYLLHTIRVFYDMFEREFGSGTPEHHRQRAAIHALDRQGLDPSRVRGHFVNGHEPFKRLYAADPWWRQINFSVLHHPPALTGFREPRAGQYVFLPGRLHRWKRVDLVIEAFKHLKRDVRLKISGTGEDEPALRALAQGDPRIEFLGKVGDEQLLDLYAGALVVPFVPVNEDYGLITIEAFQSQKPVITCRDSGEPTLFVRDFETGFVAPPEPAALAERLEYLVDHPDEAAQMGRNGLVAAAEITWDRVISALLAPVRRTRLSEPTRLYSVAPNGRHQVDGVGHLGHAPNGVTAQRLQLPPSEEETYEVAVLDMQPIDPPIGGGRIRLLGLYHGLGEDLPTTYLGTYDWPGPGFRQHRLSPTLAEIDVPLSEQHFAASAKWQQQAGGKTVIDVSFDLLAHHSPEFVDAAKARVSSAEIVVFSHPWVYPLVRERLRRRRQLVVYDAQNVEGFLRATLLDDRGFGTQLVRHVLRIEGELCHEADLILACSHEDRELFHSLYGVALEKIAVIPNGTFTTRITPPDEATRQEAKRRLGLTERPLAIFIGSSYGPNVEAAEFICSTLAPAVPDVTFAICGGVGLALDATAGRELPNVRVTGPLEEDEKLDYLAAADLAVNPMFSGSGTNVKMFDFMTAGLPVATTATGARGITPGPEPAFHVSAPEVLAAAVRRLVSDRAYAAGLGAAARHLVEERYSWERISANLGRYLRRARQTLDRCRPFFSVVVPAYERPDHLDQLVESLAMQTFRDFEVIIVDQSQAAWPSRSRFPELDLLYLHTDVKGAVPARNTGAFYARGHVIAFIDDDCLALPDWLENAARHFDDSDVVGVEGLILSDRRDDPNYRAVTNLGFEGIGFMTANLLVRRETFNALDGFDARFDHPHFREDTDLGWRAQDYGRIPFGHDVRVYHPPHLRDDEREGTAHRTRFFEKDALLLAKHPDRYRSLFLMEGHYRQTPGFREHLLRGAQKYGVALPEFYLSLLAEAAEKDASRTHRRAS